MKVKVFGFGVAYCIFWFVFVAITVGDVLPESTVSVWDALSIPILIGVFPFVLGLSVFWDADKVWESLYRGFLYLNKKLDKENKK